MRELKDGSQIADDAGAKASASAIPAGPQDAQAAKFSEWSDVLTAFAKNAHREERNVNGESDEAQQWDEPASHDDLKRIAKEGFDSFSDGSVDTLKEAVRLSAQEHHARGWGLEESRQRDIRDADQDAVSSKQESLARLIEKTIPGVSFRESGGGSRYATLNRKTDMPIKLRVADHHQVEGGGFNQGTGSRMGESDVSWMVGSPLAELPSQDEIYRTVLDKMHQMDRVQNYDAETHSTDMSLPEKPLHELDVPLRLDTQKQQVNAEHEQRDKANKESALNSNRIASLLVIKGGKDRQSPAWKAFFKARPTSFHAAELSQLDDAERLLETAMAETSKGFASDAPKGFASGGKPNIGQNVAAHIEHDDGIMLEDALPLVGDDRDAEQPERPSRKSKLLDVAEALGSIVPPALWFTGQNAENAPPPPIKSPRGKSLWAVMAGGNGSRTPATPDQTRLNPVEPAQTRLNPVEPAQTRLNPVEPATTRQDTPPQRGLHDPHPEVPSFGQSMGVTGGNAPVNKSRMSFESLDWNALSPGEQKFLRAQQPELAAEMMARANAAVSATPTEPVPEWDNAPTYRREDLEAKLQAEVVAGLMGTQPPTPEPPPLAPPDATYGLDRRTLEADAGTGTRTGGELPFLERADAPSEPEYRDWWNKPKPFKTQFWKTIGSLAKGFVTGPKKKQRGYAHGGKVDSSFAAMASPPSNDAADVETDDSVAVMLKPGEVVLNGSQQSKLGQMAGTSTDNVLGDAGVPGFGGKASPENPPAPEDTVPATLKAGDVVLNESQQTQIGGKFKSQPADVFKAIGVPGFAAGGQVPSDNGPAVTSESKTPGSDSSQPRGYIWGGVVAAGARLLGPGIAKAIGKAVSFRGTRAMKAAARRAARSAFGFGGKTKGGPRTYTEQMGADEHGPPKPLFTVGEGNRTSGGMPGGETAQLMVKALPPFVKDIAAATIALAKFAEGLNESNRYLIKYNGAIASAFAQLDVGRFQRDVQQGEATSTSTTDLTQAINSFEQTMQPMRETMATAFNVLGIIAVTIAEVVAKIAMISPLFQIMAAAAELYESLNKGNKDVTEMQKTARQMLGINIQQPPGNPPPGNPPPGNPPPGKQQAWLDVPNPIRDQNQRNAAGQQQPLMPFV